MIRILILACTYIPTYITIDIIWHKCDDCEAIFHIDFGCKVTQSFSLTFFALKVYLFWSSWNDRHFLKNSILTLEIKTMSWISQKNRWLSGLANHCQPLPSGQPAFLWLTQLIRNFEFLNNATFSFIREMRKHRSWDVKVLYINMFWSPY